MTMRRRDWLCGFAALALPAALPNGALGAVRDAVVIVGGVKSHGPRQHDFPEGVPELAAALRQSPDLPKGLRVVAYPEGWPSAPDALAQARTVVWYFDGLDRHPLRDPAARARFDALMKGGVGLVALHQASTLSAGDDLPLPLWLGAARYGMPDRTDETVAFTPARHAVSRGVGPFSVRDEFYPTLTFADAGVTPILVGELHGVGGDTTTTVRRSVAWAYERPGGGRSFGYTGLHYLDVLQQPPLRRLIVNAILWTASPDAEAAATRGARSGADPQ